MMKLSLFLNMILLLSGLSCDRQRKSSEAIVANEMLITNTFNTYMDSCWNKGNITGMKDISTENFIRNLNGITVVNSQKEMQAHMTVFLSGFPDFEVKSDSIFIMDHIIFMHWTSKGTHTGIYGEIPATGKKVHISGLSHLYFNTNGKLEQEDVVFNELQLLQQLGYTLTPPVLE